jgi:hypothetical protein
VPVPLLNVQLLLLFVVNVAPVQDVLEEQAVVQSLMLDTRLVFIVEEPVKALFSIVVKLLSFDLSVFINSAYVL